MTWMLGPEECTGYQGTAEQGATMAGQCVMMHYLGSPTMVNTGSGVPIQSTDEQVCMDDALSKAVYAGSQVFLPRIKLKAVHAGRQVVLPRIKLPMQVGCGVLNKVTPRLVAMVAVMTKVLGDA